MAIRDTKLPIEAKSYIVCALACCEKPRNIIAEVEETWGVKLFPKSLNHYNPNRNPRLDEELKGLYYQTRESFWKDRSEASMNCLNYRQRERERLFFRCDRNPALQVKILRDAAKDAGGMFSSVRVIEMRHEINPPVRRACDITDFSTASNEELALAIWESSVELVSADTADFMAEKGFIPEWRANERRAQDEQANEEKDEIESD